MRRSRAVWSPSRHSMRSWVIDCDEGVIGGHPELKVSGACGRDYSTARLCLNAALCLTTRKKIQPPGRNQDIFPPYEVRQVLNAGKILSIRRRFKCKKQSDR